MRKALSLVLVLALVLGSFSMAFAATPAGLSDIAGNANEEAIQVAYDLGIVTGNPDGTYLPAKAVNRAEFAALITRALAVPDSALAGYTATSFKDTAGYDWAVKYLAFCESKGIMLGDGQGNVMPGRTININEAVTMVLRAIGYTNNSDMLVGTWPGNYVSLAQDLDLYDDVSGALTVNKADAAQIVYNALTLTKVKVATDGTTEYVLGGGNLLTTGLNCTTATVASIDIVEYGTSVINLSKYLGAKGTVYKNSDSDIVAFVSDSTALTGKVDSGGKFDVNGTDYTLPTGFTNASGPAIVIKNAEVRADGTTLGGLTAYADSGYVTLNVDLSGKTIKEIYSAYAWQATYARVVTASDLVDITNEKFLTGDFVKDSDGNIDADQFELIGAANLNAIAKDNVAYIYEDSGDDIRKVAIGTTVVEGKVTAKASDGSYVVINGKQYKKATLNGSPEAEDLPALNDTAKLRLDADGKSYDVTKISGTVAKYGVAKYFEDPASALDNNRIQLYTSDDATKTFTFVDWEDVDFGDVPNASVTGITVASLYGYDVDASGDIDTFDVDAVELAPASNTYLQSDKVIYLSGAAFDVASDVVVFTYSGGNGLATTTSITYDLTTISKVDKSTQFGNTIAYLLNGDGDVAALVVPAGNADTETDDIYGVVNVVENQKSGDDNIQMLTGFFNGTEGTKYTTKDETSVAFTLGLYKFVVDGAGNIKDAVVVTTPHALSETGPCVVINAQQITNAGISSDYTTFTFDGGAKISVAANATVYEAVYDVDGALDYYAAAKLTDITDRDVMYLYETKTGSDHNGVPNVIIFRAR